jgi:hypothetical protein
MEHAFGLRLPPGNFAKPSGRSRPCTFHANRLAAWHQDLID